MLKPSCFAKDQQLDYIFRRGTTSSSGLKFYNNTMDWIMRNRVETLTDITIKKITMENIATADQLLLLSVAESSVAANIDSKDYWNILQEN